MLVLLDTTVLTLLLKPTAPPPNDPATGLPVTRAPERVKYLIEGFAAQHARILIPSTAWAEFLVAADETAQEYLAAIKGMANFEIVPFDSISAVEAAIDQRRASQVGNKKVDFDGSRQCLKADRQIMAIAKTRAVDMVYASDNDFGKIGVSMRVPVTLLWELPLPPSTMPLFDGGDTAADASPSSAPQPPSEQSHDDEKT
jgi:predicted nucleic acid-binding protein